MRPSRQHPRLAAAGRRGWVGRTVPADSGSTDTQSSVSSMIDSKNCSHLGSSGGLGVRTISDNTELGS
jgi:hypothetical protein